MDDLALIMDANLALCTAVAGASHEVGDESQAMVLQGSSDNAADGDAVDDDRVHLDGIPPAFMHTASLSLALSSMTANLALPGLAPAVARAAPVVARALPAVARPALPSQVRCNAPNPVMSAARARAGDITVNEPKSGASNRLALPPSSRTAFPDLLRLRGSPSGFRCALLTQNVVSPLGVCHLSSVDEAADQHWLC